MWILWQNHSLCLISGNPNECGQFFRRYHISIRRWDCLFVQPPILQELKPLTLVLWKTKSIREGWVHECMRTWASWGRSSFLYYAEFDLSLRTVSDIWYKSFFELNNTVMYSTVCNTFGLVSKWAWVDKKRSKSAFLTSLFNEISHENPKFNHFPCKMYINI